MTEIDEVVQKYGVRQFRFSDDNLTAKRDMLEKMCEKLKGRDIAWRASIRVRPNDVEMFDLMRQAGCVEVCFGIESGDQTVLNALQKRATVEDNRTAITNAYRAGLMVRILFMVGTPGENTATVDRNISFLESVKDFFDTIAVTNFTPLPGSQVSENPEECGCESLNSDIKRFNLCLWGADGSRNQWHNHLRPHALTLEQLTKNKERMVEYVLSTGKSNRG